MSTNFENLIKNLNSQQLKAVQKIDGPVMVIAGPGTGKTQLLTTRIANILKHEPTSASNILCLTYTNAGVTAMRNRLIDTIGAEANNCMISTFHSFCDHIMSKYGDKTSKGSSTLLDDLTYKKLVRSLIDEHIEFGTPLKEKVTNVDESIKFLISFFDAIKKENLNTAQMKIDYEAEMQAVKASELYRYKVNTKNAKKDELMPTKWIPYENRVKKHIQALDLYDKYLEIFNKENYRDFHTTILDAIALIKSNPDVQYDLREQYEYVMIDEFQDTNGSQLEIVSSIFDPEDQPNIMIVGDEDQAIYRFQGANVQNIVDFHQTFLSHYSMEEQIERVIILTDNYRSIPSVIASSRHLISSSKENNEGLIEGHKLTKKIVSAKAELKHIETPSTLLRANEITDMYIALANQIKDWQSKGASYKQMAVLFPTNNKAIDFSRYLDVLNIPFSLSKDANLLEDELILDLLELIKLIQQFVSFHSVSKGSFNRLMMSSFSKLTLNEISKFWSEYAQSKENNQDEKLVEFISNYKDIPQIGFLWNSITECTKKYYQIPLERYFHYILDQFLIKEWAMNQEKKLDIIQKLDCISKWILDQKMQKKIKSISDFINHIEDYIKEDIEIPFVRVYQNPESVRLYTYHASKGLEWKYVVVAEAGRYSNFGSKVKIPLTGINLENFINNEKDSAEKDSEHEEKRRLLYVAMTRAEEHLIVADYISTKSSEKPNVFISELPYISAQELKETPNIGAIMLENKIETSEEDYLTYSSINETELDLKIEKLYENNYINDRIKNFSLSHSGISQYLKCPLSFYAEKIVKIPSDSNFHLQFGDFYHKTLEQYFLDIKNDKSTHTYEYLYELAVKTLEPYKMGLTEIEFNNVSSSLKVNLETLYSQYISKIENFNYEIEENIEISLDHIKLNGKIDKFDLNINQVTITDFKTGGHKKAGLKMKSISEPKDPNNPKFEETYGGDYWRQAHIYALLMKNKYPQFDLNSVNYTFIIPEDNQLMEKQVVITPDNLELVSNIIKDVHQKIQNKNFDGCKDPECRWCKYAVDTNS